VNDGAKYRKEGREKGGGKKEERKRKRKRKIAKRRRRKRRERGRREGFKNMGNTLSFTIAKARSISPNSAYLLIKYMLVV
jgi:hypothetical protein